MTLPSPPVPHGLWLTRIVRRAARLRRIHARQHRARLRHRIPKESLVRDLFGLLDTNNSGVLGHTALTEFALLTGFPRDTEQLFDEVEDLRIDIGRSTGTINLEQFRILVSKSGKLHMTKAALRRTIRFRNAPEISGPRPRFEHDGRRSLKHLKIGIEAKGWKDGIIWNHYTPRFLNPNLCRDPSCPLKLHPKYFNWIEQ